MLPQPDQSMTTEEGTEEGDKISGPNTDNPTNDSPDNPCVYIQYIILQTEYGPFSLKEDAMLHPNV